MYVYQYIFCNIFLPLPKVYVLYNHENIFVWRFRPLSFLSSDSVTIVTSM